jgi:hypothetical protein
MNVIFMEDGTISPVDMPPIIDFEMRDGNVTPVDDSAGDATFSSHVYAGTPVASVNKTPFPYPPVAMGTATSVPVNHSRCNYPLNARLVLGNLSRVKSRHGKARCKALDGRTVFDALCMHYFVGGKYVRYKCSDLHYDVGHGCLHVHIPPADPAVPTVPAPPQQPIPAVPVPPVVNSTFSTLPLIPVDDHINGLRDASSSQWFTDDAIHAITQFADINPLLEGESWTMQLEVDGKEELYSLQPDRTPHDMQPVCHSTFALSSTDTCFMTHKSLRQLDTYPRKEEALRAIADEYSCFDKRCLWKLCRLPDGATCKRMMLLGKVKYLPSGKEEKLKFRSVVCGQEYVKGRDCDYNCFAPNAHITTARCMAYDAVANDLCFKSCDVKQAFTFGQADRRTFVRCPPGRKQQYDEDGTPLVYEITGNIYGSPGAPKRWNIAVHNAMIKLGFTQSACDPCLYTKNELKTLVYTDDFLSCFPNTCSGKACYKELVTMLTTKFELGNDGYQDCTDFIGMHFEFNANRSAVIVTQPLKISELCNDAGLETCRPVHTPGMPNVLLSDRDCPADNDSVQLEFMKNKPFRKRVGQLLWIARSTRPDISYQVNALARVAHNPGKAHWDASTFLIRYMSHTRDMGLVYRRPDKIPHSPTVWSDATWASDYGTWYDNYRSTSGFCTTGNSDGSNMLSWGSLRQSVIALSSAESEWYAAVESAKEALYVQKIFVDLGLNAISPMTLRCDNQSTIKQSLMAVNQRNSRHIGMKAHFLRHLCHAGKIVMDYVCTTEQLADVMTKCLPKPTHVYLRRKMGILTYDEFNAIPVD